MEIMAVSGSVLDHGQGGSWNSKEAHESHKFGVRSSSYNSYVCNRSPFDAKMDFSKVPCGSEINFMFSSVYSPV